MTHVLLLVGIFAGAGIALYSMVCERIEAGSRRHATRRALNHPTGERAGVPTDRTSTAVTSKQPAPLRF